MIDKEKIEKLAVICAEKEFTAEAHGMANTPTKYDDRVEAIKKYSIARAEAFEARQNLEKAIRGE